MRSWIVALIALLLGAFVLYRSYALESRVHILSKIVERSSKSQSRGNPENADKRLRELETNVKTLTGQIGSVYNGAPDPTSATGKKTMEGLNKLMSPKHFDERVLSLLDAEKQKAIDAQLKWHRDALVDYRMDSLDYFAADQKLSAGQLSALRSILEDEVDKMVEILRTPAMLADQKKGLAAWIQVIRDTDKDAGEVLNAQQMKVYRHFRRLEQQVLTPWLPEKDRS
jgi:hypothetical protein